MTDAPSIMAATPRKETAVAGRPRQEPDDSTYAGQFSARLKLLVERRGLTAEEFASKVGVSDQAVWHWISGRRVPPIDRWPAIAQALGLKSPRQLLP